MSKVWAIYSDKRYMGVLRALSFHIALSRLAMLVETLARSFWRVFTLLLTSYSFIAFDGLTVLGPIYARWTLWGVAAVLLVLLVLGVRTLEIPTRQQAIDRLDAGILAQPLASLRDHPVTAKGDELTGALWDAHQARMAEIAVKGKASPLMLNLNARDPFGLRFMAMIATLVALVFTAGVERETIIATLSGGSFNTASGPLVEAWANPPPYTGVPTIYLSGLDSAAPLRLPQGTAVVFRIYNASDKLAFHQTVTHDPMTESRDFSAVVSASLVVDRTGIITVMDGRDTLAEWQFITTPDTPPSLRIPGPPTRGAGGVAELAFDGIDDYGIESGQAVITLDLDAIDRRYGLAVDPEPRDPIVVNLPISARGPTAEISEILIEDFSEHIWVNLPVTIEMTVLDGAGQTGNAKVKGILHGKRFFLPIAATLVEQRRDLLWSSNNDRRVLQVLRAATHLPTDLNLSPAHYLNIRTIIRRLEYMLADGMSGEVRQEIAQALWDIAVLLEDGDLEDARERLRRAQEKLLQAIEDDAAADEISELMEELRDASENYMEMMAQNAEGEQQQRSDNTPPPVDGADQLQQMLEQLQQLAENGEDELAKQLLEEMQQMMDQSRFAEQQGEDGQRMQDLQDTLNSQQSLSDDTFRELQELLDQGQETSESGQELADRQEALREFLEQQLSQQGEPRSPSDIADEKMADARDNLQDGDLGDALNDQAAAIENLRESLRQLGEEMQQTGQGRDGLQAGETENGDSESDPLGRPLGMTGSTTGGDTSVPDVNSSERAQSLLDEIRRRTGDTTRPTAEIEYLNRLLDRF